MYASIGIPVKSWYQIYLRDSMLVVLPSSSHAQGSSLVALVLGAILLFCMGGYTMYPTIVQVPSNYWTCTLQTVISNGSTLPTEDPSVHRHTDVKMTDLRETHLNGASTSPAGHHGCEFGNLPSTPKKPLPEPGPTSPPSQSADSPPRAMTSNGIVGAGVADFFNP